MSKELLEVVSALFALLAVALGLIGTRMRRKVRRLEDEIDYLKWDIHRETSGVNPESGRRLISETQKLIRILDINALATLHHSSEALIDFLGKRGTLLQILLLDPDSGEFKRREQEERDSSIRIFTEWIATQAILKDIETKSKGEIELYLFTEAPDRYLLIVDALDEADLDEHSRMLINYYPEETGGRGYIGEQFMAEYLRERDRDSIYKNLRHYNNCLDGAKRIGIEETYDKYVGALSRLHETPATPQSQ